MLRNRSFHSWSGPIVGALVGVYLAYRWRVFGQEVSIAGVAVSAGLGFVGGSVIWLIEYIEQKAKRSEAPNTLISKMLLVLVPLTFWIPLLGLLVASVAIYRAHWLTLPEWISFILVCFFFLAVGITLVCTLFFGVESLVGR